ncbi:MAG: sigma-70 family RNA polymerase sigma factor [Prevotella sp.]|nr:sigma-70 family RNA polymerase sigma factor [Prevotella sp.]
MERKIINAQIYEQLFKDKYEQLYYFAYDYVTDEDVARDIVSEMFTQVWKKRQDIDISKINSYLHMAVRNRCLDYLRLVKRKNRFEEAYPTLYTEVDDNSWMEREERIAELQAAIRQLPERTQWVLRQRYEGHKSYQEIADELGISLNGMKKLMNRTFTQLRDLLNAKKDKNKYTNRQLLVLLMTMFG